MPRLLGFAVNALSCGYLISFSIIFCFPSTLPVDANNMNYTIVIVSGWTLLATVWLFFNGNGNAKAMDPIHPECDKVAGNGIVGQKLVSSRDKERGAA